MPKTASTLTALLILALPAGADVKLPQPSPAATVTQEIGITKISIEYHRPGVKGRKVWGGLVPYGEVWRLGANDATTISFSDPVKVAGRDVPAGTYALFAIPGKESWTLILNKEPKQWGAYFHKPALDLLRFDVKPEPGPDTEWMTIALVPNGPGAARLDWSWERLRFSFPIEVDTTALVWAQIDKAMTEAKPDDWALYLQAARYAREQKTRLADAAVWVDKAMAAKESFWNYELKGLLLHDGGKTAEAIPLVEKAIVLSKPAGAPQGYRDNLEKMLAEWRKETR